MNETMKVYLHDPAKGWVLDFEVENDAYIHTTLEEHLIWKFLAGSKEYKRFTSKLNPEGTRTITIISNNGVKVVYTIKRS